MGGEQLSPSGRQEQAEDCSWPEIAKTVSLAEIGC